MAADRADIVVLSVPPYYAGDTVEAIEDVLDEETILVTPAVGMNGDEDGMHYHPPGSEASANSSPSGLLTAFRSSVPTTTSRRANSPTSMSSSISIR